MLTQITPKDERNIKKFTKIINKGPFKCLNDKACSNPQSDYIVNSSGKKHKNIYACAVAQAWLDVCRSVKVNDSNRSKIRNTQDKMANMLAKYFEEKPKDRKAFDAWYDSTLSNATINTPLTVGQAQKIINMSFKYLMCCSDLRENKLAHFSWCHMPLDKYTLEWLGLDGLVWSKIKDRELYFVLADYARSKVGEENVLLKEFEIWQKHIG